MKEIILNIIRRKTRATSSDLVKSLGISRQAVAKHLRDLVFEKKLLKFGSTKSAFYVLFDSTKETTSFQVTQYRQELALKNLEEDVVFKELSMKMSLRNSLSRNSFNICNYAFSEMLNNAIEHSCGSRVNIQVNMTQNSFEFEIRDDGIGVFEHIRKHFSLKSHIEAVEHLLKGKQTTDPERHSGQGIFFTSKIADFFALEAVPFSLKVDNQIDDVFLHNIKKLAGTKVSFKIKRQTRKNLRSLFEEYSNENYEFDKTKILIKITALETENISRSQAKRILHGLESFKTIILDFKGVEGIGQGFADEIFRVYKSQHPDKVINVINVSSAVDFMIKRSVGVLS